SWPTTWRSPGGRVVGDRWFGPRPGPSPELGVSARAGDPREVTPPAKSANPRTPTSQFLTPDRSSMFGPSNQSLVGRSRGPYGRSALAAMDRWDSLFHSAFGPGPVGHLRQDRHS